MKECDIFRGEGGNSDPYYIFSGESGPPQPPGSNPWPVMLVLGVGCMSTHVRLVARVFEVQ